MTILIANRSTDVPVSSPVCHDLSSSSSTTMFASLNTSRSSTFALARYGKDYLPTRERSHDGASIYTYKSTWDGLNYNPVTERKNRSECFSGSVFGTIREVLPSEDGTHFVVRIGRPSGVTCAVRDLYSKQARRMMKIITEDSKDAPGTIGFSWFNRTRSEDRGGHNTSTHFYVVIRANSREAFEIYAKMICVPEVIGKVARFVVNLEREDRGEGAALHKTYTMTSVHWDVEEHDCLPMMRVPYSCDLGTPNCRFCVRLQSKAEARATTRFS